MKHMLSLVFTFLILISSFSTAHSADPRFIDLNNGAMFDTKSNLIWMKNECFGPQTWANAIALSDNLASGQCGLSDGSKAGDWHLPEIEELRIFVDDGYRADTLNAAGFSGFIASYYWSSTTLAYYPYYAWGVDFGGGGVGSYGKGYGSCVRCVRGGQSGSLGSLIILQTNLLSQNTNIQTS